MRERVCSGLKFRMTDNILSDDLRFALGNGADVLLERSDSRSAKRRKIDTPLNKTRSHTAASVQNAVEWRARMSARDPDVPVESKKSKKQKRWAEQKSRAGDRYAEIKSLESALSHTIVPASFHSQFKSSAKLGQKATKKEQLQSSGKWDSRATFSTDVRSSTRMKLNKEDKDGLVKQSADDTSEEGSSDFSQSEGEESNANAVRKNDTHKNLKTMRTKHETKEKECPNVGEPESLKSDSFIDRTRNDSALSISDVQLRLDTNLRRSEEKLSSKLTVNSNADAEQKEIESFEDDEDAVVQITEDKTDNNTTRTITRNDNLKDAPNLAIPDSKGITARKACYVPVLRTDEMEEFRKLLPIYMDEQRIMEAISENDVVVLSGETGSGKTTQLPQFLYEAGYGSSQFEDRRGRIGVTEPRRLAAVAMAKRVRVEMNMPGRVIAHQIRHDSTVVEDTQIKFMTDGILLREIQTDFLLKDYSVIVLDEAHERSVNTDILIGLLSRIVKLRRKIVEGKLTTSAVSSAFREGATDTLNIADASVSPRSQSVESRQKEKLDSWKPFPLKLVIMSATLRANDFLANEKLFSVRPPLVRVESRQYPVSVHFSRSTPQDYMKAAIAKAVRIHKRLPLGDILIFLTGKDEILNAVKELSRLLIPFKKSTDKRAISDSIMDTEDDYEEENEFDKIEDLSSKQFGIRSVEVVPLFSSLPMNSQAKVFSSHEEGVRRIVVSTNVAETSVTIPGIVYVVDAGREKYRDYDMRTGIASYKVRWISQANAIQRAGRAGRTRPGHCYRLYSSALMHDALDKFSQPEILRIPIDSVVLMLKSLGIQRVSNFPFPTPVPESSIATSVSLLQFLGALTSSTTLTGRSSSMSNDGAERLTDIGMNLALLPVAPRLGKMLWMAYSHNIALIDAMIAVIAILSVPEGLWTLNTDTLNALTGDSEEHTAKHSWTVECREDHSSDILTALKFVGASDYEADVAKFCLDWRFSYKVLKEIGQIREQLTEIVSSVWDLRSHVRDMKLLPLRPAEREQIRLFIAAGYPDQVARLELKERKVYKSCRTQSFVRIHPASCLCASPIVSEFVVYHDLLAQDPAKVAEMKASRPSMSELDVAIAQSPRLIGVTRIKSDWLIRLGTVLCEYLHGQDGKSSSLAPKYDATADCVVCTVQSSYGPLRWDLPHHIESIRDVERFASSQMRATLRNLRYRTFARAFLEGSVLPEFRVVLSLLSSHPAVLTTEPYIAQHKVVDLLISLEDADVDSKAKLLALLSSDHSVSHRIAIGRALESWVLPSRVAAVRTLWSGLAILHGKKN